MQKLAAAFVKAQTAFSPALKSKTNPHFKNDYADLASCVGAVIGALNENGIALLQPCHECTDGVLIETVFLHESGETYSAGKLHVPASKKDAQGYGSALTYARRYGLMAACGIAPEDDDGNAAASAQQKQAPNMPAILDAISSATNMESLKGHFAAAWQMLEGENRDAAKAAYDKRRDELEPQQTGATA